MKLTNRELVKSVLQKIPATRDNDNMLLLMVWETEIELNGNKPLILQSYSSFAHLILNNKLSHFESVRRNRQRLQAEFPELRGQFYGKRKTIAVEEIQEELGYIKTPPNAPGTTP